VCQFCHCNHSQSKCSKETGIAGGLRWIAFCLSTFYAQFLFLDEYNFGSIQLKSLKKTISSKASWFTRSNRMEWPCHLFVRVAQRIHMHKNLLLSTCPLVLSSPVSQQVEHSSTETWLDFHHFLRNR
jgi:hypothetical protein